jgi:hypothetical protein
MSLSNALRSALGVALKSSPAANELLGVVDIAVPGTAEASKALVLSASKGATGLGPVALDTADTLLVGGVIVPQDITLSFAIQLNATVTEYDIFVAPYACQVTGIRYVPSTLQGGAMTATVCKASGTSAPANGTTPMHTANSINLNANAYTAVNVTLTSTTADLQLATGDRIGIDYSAAPTAAFWTLTITLKRI